MIYKHKVKRNGIYYAAGEDVPENKEPIEKYVSDEDITLETGTTEDVKSPGRRGRPKKPE